MSHRRKGYRPALLAAALLTLLASWLPGVPRRASLAQGNPAPQHPPGENPAPQHPPGETSAPQHPPGEYVTVNGARLWVESEGKGAPVILIAGGPGLTHDCFHPFLSGLASGCRLIYYDAFGRGKSDRAKSPAEYTFSRDVEDLDGLRKALGLTKVSLCAHSYGALVALAYAFRHPDFVGKVAVVNGIFSGKMWQESDDDANRQVREKLPDVWAKVQSLRAQGLRSSSAAHQEAYRLPPGFYWHRRPERRPQLSVNSDVYYAIVGEDADFVIDREVAGLDFESRLKELHVPLLVLAGRYDNIAPIGHALAIAKSAPPGVSVVVLEQSGHFTYVEETEKTLQLLGDFFAK
jgi:proline iminopeptidase